MRAPIPRTPVPTSWLTFCALRNPRRTRACSRSAVRAARIRWVKMSRSVRKRRVESAYAFGGEGYRRTVLEPPRAWIAFAVTIFRRDDCPPRHPFCTPLFVDDMGFGRHLSTDLLAFWSSFRWISHDLYSDIDEDFVHGRFIGYPLNLHFDGFDLFTLSELSILDANITIFFFFFFSSYYSHSSIYF